MSELILHAAHLSEAHQLRFSYLFEVAAKHWRDKQPSQTAKAATELWVIDAHSAPDAIQNRSNSSFVLLIPPMTRPRPRVPSGLTRSMPSCHRTTASDA